VSIINRQEILAAIKNAISVALKIFESNPVPRNVWTKINMIGQHEEVCNVDIAVQDCLTHELSAAYPDVIILSEESDEASLQFDMPLCFILDPIDGTREFIRGSQHFSVSVAAISYGKIVCGAVAYPAIGWFLHAVLNGGAFYGDQPLFIKPTPEDHFHNHIAVSPREIDLPEMQIFHKQLVGSKLIQISALTPKVGACLIGQVDAALYLSVKGSAYIWDYAAVALIAKEAGFFFTDLSGLPMLDKLTICHNSGWVISHPFQHLMLLDALSSK
jgi:myo-inositol-1(or 4)-monophosphatase